MKANELRERSDKELQELLLEAKNQLFHGRIKNATHQLTDTSSLQKGKREVARINTILTERATAAKEKQE